MMQVRIDHTKEKKFIGKRLHMSLTDNRTGELWRSFMPRRKEIKNMIGNDLYSMQRYAADHFNVFDPATIFEKLALIEVADFIDVPPDLETFVLPEGKYAVFLHKGPASNGRESFRYIFETWLPSSGYVLDNRPHFEILGERYKNEDPDSEEEIWIPIKTA